MKYSKPGNDKPVKKKNVHKQKKTSDKKSARYQSGINRDAIVQQDVVHKRKKRKKNHILSYLILIILFICIGTVLSLTVFFKIDNVAVDIKGADKNEIIVQSGIKNGDNLILTNTSAAEKRILEANYTFDSVKVKKHFPSNIVITATQAAVVYNIKYDNKYYNISGGGRIIGITSQKASGAITVYGAMLPQKKLGDYIDKTNIDIALLQRIEKSVKSNSIGTVSAIDITDSANMKIYIEKKYMIRLGNEKDIDYKLHDVKTIISQKIDKNQVGEFDASISGKIYFRHLLEAPDPENSESEE